jgi:YD repeat-containing protein
MLTTTTGYDGAERPNRVQDPLGRTTTVTYEAAGNRIVMAYPNATNTTCGYGRRNRLLHEATGDGCVPGGGHAAMRESHASVARAVQPPSGGKSSHSHALVGFTTVPRGPRDSVE